MEINSTGFFEESPGKKSYIRLAGFVLLWADLLIILWHEVKHRGHMGAEAYSDNYLVFQCIILGFVFFPKVMQKIIEGFIQIKAGIKESTTTQSTTQQTVSETKKE